MRAILTGLVLAASCARADEIDIARSALRDELWEIARAHAERVEGVEAELVILESYAREGSWDDVIRSLESLGEDTVENFIFYRALALLRTDRREDAAGILDTTSFHSPELASRALLLRAELARRENRPEALVKLAKSDGYPLASIEGRMLAAWAYERTGEEKEAARLWREVVADESADDDALSTAATKLGDLESLQAAVGRLKSAKLRRSVGLRLGRAKLASEATFDEGAQAIRLLAKEDPDADGAMECFLALAEAWRRRERYAESADAFAKALEAWPEAGRIALVHEGRAWALRKLGKNEEALRAFVRAEETATADDNRAQAMLAQGEILKELQRPDESMAKLRLVLERYPETPTGRKVKVLVDLQELDDAGRSLFRSCCFPEAQEKFAEIARRDPARKPRMDYLAVLCLYGQGRDVEAVEKAERLAKECPDAVIRAEMTLWLAKSLFNESRWRESRDLFALYATNLVPTSAQAPSALKWASRASYALRDYQGAVDLVTLLMKSYPDSAETPAALLIQAEALIAKARLDEAIVVLDRVISNPKQIKTSESDENILLARRLRADALFAMGADNSVRYTEALEGYRQLLQGVAITPDERLQLSFKIAHTYEKLRRVDEAIEQYYSGVVLAYRTGRVDGIVFSEESVANFSNAGFRLARIFASRGEDNRAEHVLQLVAKSDIAPAIIEKARDQLSELQKKGTPQ